MHIRRLNAVAATLAAALLLTVAQPAVAQQRPLVTQDPETIGAGRILIQGGVDFAHDQVYPLSGLKGDLWRIPTIGFIFGISSIAELQIEGGLYDYLSISERHPAPLASLMTVTGDSTHDFEDIFIGTKIRLIAESESSPSVGFRFSTRLPNASNESGLGTDSFDFYASLLVGKTIQSVRIVGNVGVGILADPTSGNRQNDDLTYGASLARAITQQVEFVGEVNGRLSTRSDAFPGTESSGLIKAGGRYTKGPLRLDGAVFFGMTSVDPTIGFTAGFTYIFDAFKVP